MPIFASIPRLEPGLHRERKHGKSPAVRSVELILNRLLDYVGLKNYESHVRLKDHGIIHDTSSAEFEAFRKLSVHIDFAHPEKRYQIIYVVIAEKKPGCLRSLKEKQILRRQYGPMILTSTNPNLNWLRNPAQEHPSLFPSCQSAWCRPTRSWSLNPKRCANSYPG